MCQDSIHDDAVPVRSENILFLMGQHSESDRVGREDYARVGDKCRASVTEERYDSKDGSPSNAGNGKSS